MAGKPYNNQSISARSGEVAQGFIKCLAECVEMNDFFMRHTDEQLIALDVPQEDIDTYRAAFGAMANAEKVLYGHESVPVANNFLFFLLQLSGVPGWES